MADSIREQIIQAVAARMAVIRTASGYHTDCGQNVSRCIPFTDASHLPRISIWPKSENYTLTASGYLHAQMKLDIEAHSVIGNLPVSVLVEQMLADLLRATGYPPGICSLVDDMTLDSGGVSTYPGVGDRVAATLVSLTVTYQFPFGEP